MEKNDFLQRKEQYLELLKNNAEYIYELIKKQDNSLSLMKKFILDPQDEKELAFANAFFTNLEVTKDFLLKIRMRELNIPSIDENIGFKFTLDYVKTCMNNGTLEDKQNLLNSYNLNDFNSCARMILEMNFIFSNSFNIDSLLEKLGFTEEVDDLTILKINNYLADAQAAINVDNYTSFNSKDDIDEYIKNTNNYCRIYQEFLERYSKKQAK